MIMFGSFLPSLWSLSNQSLLGLREPTLLCDQVCFSPETMTLPVLAESPLPILRIDDIWKRIISFSYSWENDLSRPIDAWQSLAPVSRPAGASMGWLVGPQGFEPWTKGL